MDVHSYLTAIRYPGRGILCGSNEVGNAIAAYFITGRSLHSQNRRLVFDRTTARTEAINPALVVDPSLIIYRAVEILDKAVVVANGDHSEAILEGMRRGLAFEQALGACTYEPDAPSYTPRISAIHTLRSYTMSILRRTGEGECERHFRTYGAKAGTGHLLHTYEEDTSPLVSFQGDPRPVALTGDAKTIAKSIWDGLDQKLRVALCVLEIPQDTSGVKPVLKQRGEDDAEA